MAEQKETKKIEEKKPVEAPKKEEKVETKKETKPVEKKVQPKKAKKDHAVVNAKSVPISTKYAIEICKFIKNKSIKRALEDLEQVLLKKKAVPMKGEYGHKKSVKKTASGAGRYPKVATEHFIKLLKSLNANSIANEIENPVVSEAVPNVASRPRGRFGRWKRKRTHIKLVSVEKKVNRKKK